MIGAPLRVRVHFGTSVAGASGGASVPSGTPALSMFGSGHYRPGVTESHQVVGGAPLLPWHRQK